MSAIAATAVLRVAGTALSATDAAVNAGYTVSNAFQLALSDGSAILVRIAATACVPAANRASSMPNALWPAVPDGAACPVRAYVSWLSTITAAGILPGVADTTLPAADATVDAGHTVSADAAAHLSHADGPTHSLWLAVSDGAACPVRLASTSGLSATDASSILSDLRTLPVRFAGAALPTANRASTVPNSLWLAVPDSAAGAMRFASTTLPAATAVTYATLLLP